MNAINYIILSFLGIISLLFIVQLIYSLYFYSASFRYQKKKKSQDENDCPPISVIICARDQEEHLRRNLPKILNQDYPNFEVIIINANSTDNTREYIESLEKEHKNLHHSFVPKTSRYISKKKLAVTLGIKASKYDWLVFTEPYCEPQSNKWLAKFSANFDSETSIVLGYCGYKTQNKFSGWYSALNRLIISLRYLSATIRKKPYMGVSENMAYRKDLFFKNKGYSSHLNLERGEDDIFINEVSNSTNTKVEISKEAQLLMDISSKKKRRERRMNYYITSKHYKNKSLCHVFGFELVNTALFYLITLLSIAYCSVNQYWNYLTIFILVFLFRHLLVSIILIKNMTLFGYPKKHIVYLPLFEIKQVLQSLTIKIKRLVYGEKEFTRKKLC